MKRRRKPNPAPPAPWTPAEIEKLQEISRIGLAVDFWGPVFPHRTLGDMLDMRLTLRERGQIEYARPI